MSPLPISLFHKLQVDKLTFLTNKTGNLVPMKAYRYPDCSEVTQKARPTESFNSTGGAF
jgi:hypothetical protein